MVRLFSYPWRDMSMSQIPQPSTAREVLVGLLVAGLAVIGCAGGKGLASRAERGARSAEAEVADATRPSERPDEPFMTRKAGVQDPFGRIPVEWPTGIPLHPRGIVADSGQYKKGCYLVVLVSSELATPAGIERFYVESLADWESLQVREEGEHSAEETGYITIIAERPGALLQITAGRSPSSLWETLPDSDRWPELVGPDPLLVRLCFTPVP